MIVIGIGILVNAQGLLRTMQTAISLTTVMFTLEPIKPLTPVMIFNEILENK